MPMVRLSALLVVEMKSDVTMFMRLFRSTDQSLHLCQFDFIYAVLVIVIWKHRGYL